MRRDILELDQFIQRRLYSLDLSLMEVEAMRLVLSGGSVVDWQRMAFSTPEEVDHFLAIQRIDLKVPEDRERVRYVFNEAVSYLEEHLYLRFPRDLRNPDDLRDIFLAASDPSGFRRRQVLCCVALKLMHVIHHMEAAELKSKIPVAEAELFDLAEGDILRRARVMRESGLPVLSFYGSRKARSSVITKLISKKENLAATIFDKLRFRIVVDHADALAPTLAYLTKQFFPFNYVIPGQSHNNLLAPEDVVSCLPSHTELQELIEYPGLATSGKNEFSGESYRMINFIVDYPVRVPDRYITGLPFELGRIVFVMVEFQLVDEETARLNEAGENAHALYKARQYETVFGRLVRGYEHARRSRVGPLADSDGGPEDLPAEDDRTEIIAPEE
ncbi:MAG: TIGR04552 family protein [Deltaproteobacteria bacterium]|nr:MAG: TIGR04552 family protein [Deltaproteobacteria bacterium]